jgi:hypothetical protein
MLAYQVKIYSKEDKTNIQSAFKEYLRKANPNLADSTISTYVSDAFYLFNTNVGIDFNDCIVGKVSIEETQMSIFEHLEPLRKKPKQDTKGYMRALARLKLFLGSYR